MSNSNSSDRSTPGRKAENREPPETAAGAGRADVDSDPALSDELGQDWADEGGATENGPATSSD